MANHSFVSPSEWVDWTTSLSSQERRRPMSSISGHFTEPSTTWSLLSSHRLGHPTKPLIRHPENFVSWTWYQSLILYLLAGMALYQCLYVLCTGHSTKIVLLPFTCVSLSFIPCLYLSRLRHFLSSFALLWCLFIIFGDASSVAQPFALWKCDILCSYHNIEISKDKSMNYYRC